MKRELEHSVDIGEKSEIKKIEIAFDHLQSIIMFSLAVTVVRESNGLLPIEVPSLLRLLIDLTTQHNHGL